MFFYRVRVDSQVYVVSPRKGTDITSHQSQGWVDVSSAETRNQVPASPYACSPVIPFVSSISTCPYPIPGLDRIRLHAAHALLGGVGWQPVFLGHDECFCQRALDTEGSPGIDRQAAAFACPVLTCFRVIYSPTYHAGQVSVQPVFSVFTQGWRVPSGEAPIQKIHLLVYSIGPDGLGSLSAVETDVLLDTTVNYYKVRYCQC